MIFLGACNPQRWTKTKSILHDNIGIKKDPYDIQRLNARLGRESLIYHVVPIPETMLEYIWDYGFLDGETEIAYIRTMLNKCNKISGDMPWLDYTVSLVSISQQFFRMNEDKSSVSLRDVARFCRFYNWLLNLSPEFIFEHSRIMNQEFIQQTTLVALLLTYYLRLSSSELRESYLNNISVVLSNEYQDKSNISKYLIRLLRNQQMKLIDKIKLPPGTAKNRVLIDNIFVIFACVLNRIPVILCGKPGSSKTLAVNIVLNNLKGNRSNQKLFQTLPELIPIPYQGSQNCTSENVMKLFECAEKYLDVERNTNILPVIVFDEIGLAELSSHNPLKVLHSKLEMETCRYGFIGISNWSLDAAKMNRALYLPCADPTVHDLRLTAETIASSLLETSNHLIPIDTSIVRNLAAAYFDLYEYMNEQSKYKNYFGLRDFYSLIKGVVNDLIHASTEQESYTSVRRQLGINFDGIFDGSQFLWKRFCKYACQECLIEQEQPPTFNQMIDRSLSLHNGRYLMLIGANESMFDYVERYINAKQQSTRTLIGSSLTDDLITGTTYSEQYNRRVLMDIILYAETNVTLIIRRMDHIYANLYDLFNQNFDVSGTKKYCRITLGDLYHPRFLIHHDFFCVIFVRQQDLVRCDPPFLNRFEKHIIDIESLIHSCHLIIASNLLEWIDKLLSYNTNKNFPQKKHLFVDFNPDYIHNLVMDAFDYLKISEDDNDNQRDAVIRYCKQKLICTSSFDLPLHLSCKINDDDNIQKLIEEYYNIHNHVLFSNLIDQTLNQSIISNQIIYTYTQIYEKIEYINNNDLVVEVKVGNFKSEFELRRKIKEHYRSSNARLLLIRVDYHEEHKHVLFLKHLVVNERIPTSDHGIWLVFHLQRNIMHEIKDDILFNGWSPVMIDNLNKHKLISWDVLTNPSYRNLLLHADFSLSNTTFNELIIRSFIRVRYTVACKDKESLINNRRDSIIKLLSQSNIDIESLHMIIKNRLLELIRTVDFNHSRSEFIDWRHDLLTNGTIIGSCRSIDDALRMTILLYNCNYFLMLLVDLEKSSLIDSYIFLISKTNEIIYENLKCIWFDCLKLTFESMEQTITCMNTIEISLIFDLRLPCARFEREIIRQIHEMIKKPNENIDINLSDDKLLDFAMEKLRSTSVYGKNIENILDNLELFEHYYHDQLAIVLDELRIDHLTVSFTQRLLTSNPTLTVEDKLKHLLLYHDELIELLHLFEIGIELIGEEKWNFDEQFYTYDATQMTTINNSSNLYILVQVEQQFYQVPPQQLLNNKPYECDGDPFIETSLMNLIELLISSSTIRYIDNIAQLSTAYSLVVQGVLSLNHHSINNLEKLRCFDSLVRCIMDLLPSDRALIVFKNICLTNQNNNTVFNGNFSTCETIRMFIDNLGKMIKIETKNSLNLLNCRPMLKLEMEFLKNWLIDHSEQYCTVLESISKSDKNLWFYAAKIFKYIDQKLDLMSIIKTRMTEISSIFELEGLDQYFSQSNDKTQKIERIMINRIHIYLMNSITDEDVIERYLTDYYDYFRENIYSDKSTHGLSMIVSIAWLKVYTEMYAFSLSRDNHSKIMEDIDKLLTNDESKFGLTLKIYIIKQLCQMYYIELRELYDIFVNRNCYWIKTIFSQYNHQQERKFEQNIILPTPLFEASLEYTDIKNTLDNCKVVNKLKNLIGKCSENVYSSYCFIIFFVHRYVNCYKMNIPNNDLRHLFDELHTELNACFEPIGFKLCHCLCENFRDNSYFQLNRTMTADQLHRRLVALNIVAVFLSSKAFKTSTYLSSILFDEKLKMPKNYAEHLKNFVCLPGLISNDPVDSEESNDKSRFGYPRTTPVQESNINEKPDHLNLSISFRFIHMMIHAVLLCLCELDLLDDSCLPDRNYYREHFENDYEFLCQLSTQPNQCHLWFFKLINHLIDGNSLQGGFLNNKRNVIEFEKCIENKLIIPHVDSITEEIRKYKLKYKEFLRQKDNQPTLNDLIDELFENENEYPLLNFFNITNIHISNPMDAFRAKLRIIPNVEKAYPMTIFLLQRYDDYTNIQYLYPIVMFTNYLIQKLNYRITRKNAAKKTISEVLFNDSDKDETLKLYENFIQAWYKLNFKEVRLGAQAIMFEHTYSSKDFAKRTEISKLLLNSSGDNNSLLLIACLTTIAELQNDIVKHFHNIMNSNSMNKKLQPHVISLQAIQQKHLLCFDKDFISRKLIDDGSIINYIYGNGKDIIYDYEEIEFMLRDKISCLPLIDTERLHFLNYQFELYDENTSLITDVRRRIEQELLVNKKRTELQNLIKSISNDDILHYLGSLDYIFTYLRHFEYKNASILTIKNFVEQYIHSKICLSDNLLRDSMLSTIELKYIIDLYELIEEIIFEKILRNNIKQDLPETLLFSDDKQNHLIGQFIEMTSGTITIAPRLKKLDCWINMLKRLIVRVSMNTNLSFDVPLQQYVTRCDIWTVDVTTDDIKSFKISDDILLRHTFIILKGLEATQNDPQVKTQQNDVNRQANIERPILTTPRWLANNITNRSSPEVIGDNKKTNRKLRV
ncbi:unnamed protein product [Rotaria sordida]|uniref:Uncharacterized protein n=1 Tax=Rotaria sordida TaxID=392033 RepID=A0A815ZMV9_9BILA|nr:unnamed protein product [Rotaria sordida]CAF1586246.1 unnamed protein product [Rotaria sordida]